LIKGLPIKYIRALENLIIFNIIILK